MTRSAYDSLVAIGIANTGRVGTDRSPECDRRAADIIPRNLAAECVRAAGDVHAACASGTSHPRVVLSPGTFGRPKRRFA